ncbi:hypothetical protein C3K47_18960 [Solitalea longa]|uniref:Uncharacterized protein n=1 Tax=Solitalea longa TaxID=2079460 RepID=A0A2S4ZWN2_9SPHI|nr:hypothetical protein C3K47_18960 [Solitalea longa]
MNTDKKITLVDRVKSPTPKFFRKIRTIGLMIGAVGGALLAAPVALPAVVGTIAGYLATIGVVASAVSQTAVRD